MARCRTNPNQVDRLSNLSDELLIAILSLLPTRVAARTCVLCRRFRHLWEASPSLDLNCQDFRLLSVVAVVNRALLHRDPSHPLLSLRLQLPKSLFGASDVGIVSFFKSLLLKARSLGLRHLTIRACIYSSEHLWPLLPTIFSIPSLELLNLEAHGPFESLSRIHGDVSLLRKAVITIHEINEKDVSAVTWLLNCISHVEELSLHLNESKHAHHPFPILLEPGKATPHFPNLKHLDVTICFHEHNFEVIIWMIDRSPALESLKLVHKAPHYSTFGPNKRKINDWRSQLPLNDDGTRRYAYFTNLHKRVNNEGLKSCLAAAMARRTNPNQIDRLSNLPDELLIAILSLLPTRVAALTSVLCRRFRHLWEASPSLDFKCQDFRLLSVFAMSNRALLHRDPSHPLLSLCLQLPKSLLRASDVGTVEFFKSLLLKGRSLGLRHLTIRACVYSSKHLWPLLRTIFSIPSLELLHLAAYKPLKSLPDIDGELPLLRKAVIKIHRIQENDVSAVAGLLNCISHVEELSLHLNESKHAEHPFPILLEPGKDAPHFPNLKHLDVTACFHEHNIEAIIRMLHRSPALESLKLVHKAPHSTFEQNNRNMNDWRSKLPFNDDGNCHYAYFTNLHKKVDNEGPKSCIVRNVLQRGDG